MSIATQITRLQNIKTAIRNALVNKGISGASTHDMEDFATDISNIPSGGTYQSKTVSPSTSQQTVAPDSGYDALSSVTVNAIQTQTKSATPTNSAQTITPDSGKYLSSVSVNAIQTQTKSASPSTSAQTITPDSGKYLTSVSIDAIQTETIDISPDSIEHTYTPTSGYFYDEVYVRAAELQSKTVNPSTSSQIVGADSDYYGLSSVTVNAITVKELKVTIPSAGSVSFSNIKGTLPLFDYWTLWYIGYRYVSINGGTTAVLYSSAGDYEPVKTKEYSSSVTISLIDLFEQAYYYVGLYNSSGYGSTSSRYLLRVTFKQTNS